MLSHTYLSINADDSFARRGAMFELNVMYSVAETDVPLAYDVRHSVCNDKHVTFSTMDMKYTVFACSPVPAIQLECPAFFAYFTFKNNRR